MRRAAGVALALFFVVLALYWPVQGYDFINYDDPPYVTANPYVRAGLTWAGVQYAFGTEHWAWHPLTFLSHMLDVELFGMKPGPQHLVSAALHALNTALVFLVLRKLTGSQGRSAAVALLFGVHPMRVESVAWIAERKDVLSMFWALLALWAYAYYAAARKENKGSAAAGWYALTMLGLALSLMSKAMFVTLPFALVLLDIWPLQRATWKLEAGNLRRLAWLALEKLPLLALSAGSMFMTIRASTAAHAVAQTDMLPMRFRLENALVSYARYLETTLWPQDLAILYPHPTQWPSAVVALSAAVVLALTLLCLWQARVRPYLLAGWLWYLGMLVPVIGLMQAGDQARADRFTYAPILGVLVALLWLLGDFAERHRTRQIAVASLISVAAGFYAYQTAAYLPKWKDAVTLWEHTVATTGRNSVSLYTLADAYRTAGKDQLAMDHYREALEHNPRDHESIYNLGYLMRKQGNVQGARKLYEDSLSFAGNNAPLLSDLALMWREQAQQTHDAAKLRAADELMEKAVLAGPRYVPALLNLAQDRLQKQQTAAGMQLLQRALALEPENPDVQLTLAKAMLQQKQPAQARQHAEFVLARKPDHAEAHLLLGYALAQLNQPALAEKHLRERLRLAADQASIRQVLGSVLLEQQRYTDAAGEFRRALELSPGYPPAEAGLKRALLLSGESLPN